MNTGIKMRKRFIRLQYLPQETTDGNEFIEENLTTKLPKIPRVNLMISRYFGMNKCIIGLQDFRKLNRMKGG